MLTFKYVWYINNNTLQKLCIYITIIIFFFIIRITVTHTIDDSNSYFESNFNILDSNDAVYETSYFSVPFTHFTHPIFKHQI